MMHLEPTHMTLRYFKIYVFNTDQYVSNYDILQYADLPLSKMAAVWPHAICLKAASRCRNLWQLAISKLAVANKTANVAMASVLLRTNLWRGKQSNSDERNNDFRQPTT